MSGSVPLGDKFFDNPCLSQISMRDALYGPSDWSHQAVLQYRLQRLMAPLKK